MSDNLPEKTQSEEVDLGQLFKLIGKAFDRFFRAIANFFKGLFRILILLLKPIVDNIKLIMIVLFVASIIGYVWEKTQDPIYSSDMLVKPYFESKYQLANNVNYFNALIGSSNLQELSRIFEIDTVTASELLGFEIAIGPETPNDLLKQYDTYIKSIDSSLAVEISYEQFIENRDILAGNIFNIKALSKKNDVFTSLEKGFRKTFENEYSTKLKKVRDSTILIKKEALYLELERLDSLQIVYLGILKEQSQNNQFSMSTSGMIPLIQEKSKTYEYELFEKELQTRNAIRVLDQQLIEENVYYDVLSGFEDVGSVERKLTDKHSLIFPGVVFLIMVLGYLAFNVFVFIKNYE